MNFSLFFLNFSSVVAQILLSYRSLRRTCCVQSRWLAGLSLCFATGACVSFRRVHLCVQCILASPGCCPLGHLMFWFVGNQSLPESLNWHLTFWKLCFLARLSFACSSLSCSHHRFEDQQKHNVDLWKKFTSDYGKDRHLFPLIFL